MDATRWTVTLGGRGLAIGCALALAAAVGGGIASASAAHVAPSPKCADRSPAAVRGDAWGPAKKQLAPHGANAIRLCRYRGGNAHPPGSLIGARVVTSRATIRELTDELDSLKQLPDGVHCPNDDGSKIIAVLSYPTHHQLTIAVGLSGCELVTNGDLHRTAANIAGQNPQGPKLIAQLKRMS